MPMTPEQIAGAVSYFTNKNVARSAAVATAAALPRPAGGGGGSGSGGSGGSKINTNTPNNKPTQAPVSYGFKPGERDQKIKRTNAAADQWAGNDFFKKALVGNAKNFAPLVIDALEPQGSAQRPQNFVQGVINLLSTGGYASARITHEIGRQIAEAPNRAKPQNPLEAVGQTWNDGGKILGEAARGVSEGLGNRYNNEKPRTTSGNLKEMGVFDQTRSFVKDRGGNGTAQDWFGEIIPGFAADVAADPLTYVTGTGLIKGAQGAVRAASESTRAGEGIVTALGKGAKGGFVAQREAVAAAKGAKVDRAAAKALRKDKSAEYSTLSEAEAASAAARAGEASPNYIADEAAAAKARAETVLPQDVPPGTPKDVFPQDAPLTPEQATPDAPLAPEQAIPDAPLTDPIAPKNEFIPKEDPRAAVINDLLPRLRTADKVVPTAEILSKAIPEAAPGLSPAVSQAVSKTLTETSTVPEITAAIKSIKENPEGAALLEKTFKQAGKSYTVEDAIRKAATRRITRGMVDGSVDPLHQAVLSILKIGEKPILRPPTEASLSSALEATGFGGQQDVGALLKKLVEAPAGAAREKVLQDAIGSGTGFKNFDEAMKAAVDGNVEASMMRSMLKALGINRAMSKPATMRATLAGQGTMNWEEIKNSVKTTQEVLDAHSIPATVTDAARDADIDGAAKEASDAYDKAVEEAVGHDPQLIEPINTTTPQGLVGKMVNKGIELVNNTKDVNFLERFDGDMWLAIHRTLMDAIKPVMNVQKMKGAERANFAYDRYLQAIRAVESHQRSLGQFPHLQYEEQQQALFVSFGQIFEGLPADVAKRAFFDLNYRLGKGLGREEYKQGLSIFPTTVGDGVRAAINGADAGAVRNIMAAAENAFAKTTKGQRVLDDLSIAITDPDFVISMKAMHDSQQILAVAHIMRKAENIVEPLAGKIIAAVARNGDRSAVKAAVDDALKTVKDIGPEGSLLKDIASQRVEGGVVETLGELGTAQLRADARSAKANGSKSVAENLKAQQAVAAKHAKAKRPDGKRIRQPEARIPETDKELRGKTAKNAGDFSRDAQKLIDEDVARSIDNGEYEATELEVLKAFSFHELQSNVARVFAGIGHTFEGTFGMSQLKDVQVSVTSGSYVYSHAFVKSLDAWMFGGRVRSSAFFGKSTKFDGLQNRLAGVLGQKPSPEEMNKVIASWWSALASHQKLAAERGVQLSDDELRRRLLEGVSGFGRKNVGGAAPISREQVDMVMEFNQYVHQVFAPIDGPLARSGTTMKDLHDGLGRFGFKEGQSFSDFSPPTDGAVADLASVWHSYDFALMEHPLDLLANWHKALTASTVRPSIGASISRLFDHVAEGGGKTIEELKAEGWRQIDTKNSKGLGQYIDPESFFSPEIRKQMSYLDRFFVDQEKATPALIAAINKPYDLVTGFLKSSLTIWNPRHHVTNVLGEFGALALDGVNPMYALKAVRAIKASGRLIDGDMKPIDIYMQTFREAGTKAGSVAAPRATFGNGAAGVVLRDAAGKLSKVQITAEEIWSRALADGVAITARESKDMLPGISNTGFRGSTWTRIVQHRANLIGRADKGLGEFSAVRDNTTRLAHYYSELENGSHASIEAAFQAAAKKVHTFHPTIQTLSSFDQKYTRRALFFYTWSRQALSMVLQSALERPAMVTLPSKFQYDVAAGNGLDPESFGKPAGPDPRLPSYEQNSVLGPQFEGGLMPWDDVVSGQKPNLWGVSLSSPQLDALTSFFGNVSTGGKPTPPIQRFSQGLAGQLNPLIKMPLELIGDSSADGIGKAPSTDYANYFASQTGLPYTLAGIAGATVKKPGSTPEFNAAEQQRKLFNWGTGLKLTNYTNETASKVASLEQGAKTSADLKGQGFDARQIAAIKRAQKKTAGSAAPAAAPVSNAYTPQQAATRLLSAQTATGLSDPAGTIATLTAQRDAEKATTAAGRLSLAKAAARKAGISSAQLSVMTKSEILAYLK